MLWFITINPAASQKCLTDLNTSYVMVHLFFLSAALINSRFKYILCYGSSPCFKPFLKCDTLILLVFKRLPQIFTSRSKKTSNLSKYCLTLLFSMILALFQILRLVKFYIIKLSPVSFFASPRVSSSKTLSFINFIMQTKSSSLSIT